MVRKLVKLMYRDLQILKFLGLGPGPITNIAVTSAVSTAVEFTYFLFLPRFARLVRSTTHAMRHVGKI